jgi:Domain of unknown function (DUF4124)
MRAILFTLFSIACAVALSATVYRWVDENGITHYSDQPHENAEKVTVAAPQTYSAPHQQGPSNNRAPPPKQSGLTYTCAITQPANDDTFSNANSIIATAQADPVPRQGDKVVLMFDGLTVQNFPAGGGAYQLDNLDRGTHTLQAQVQDSTGKVVCQSPTVSFTILQASILNPANPNSRH